MTGSITFKCASCEHPLVVDDQDPPNDADVICCQRCGKDFGPYAKVKAAGVLLAEAEADSEGEHEGISFMNLMDPSKG